MALTEFPREDRPLKDRASVPLLAAYDVHRILGAGESANAVLRGVSLEIARHEYVSIVGASGSGKSTLLYLLGGLDRPSQVDADGKQFDPPSRVFINGQDTQSLDDTALASVRNEHIGFVFQFHYLLKEFSAQENVALPMLKLGRLSRSAAMERAADLLKQLGLGEKVRRPANCLSGGEQQRVAALARALANEPAVLLADEPTGNLDRKNTELVAQIFADLADKGQSIVMVTHDACASTRQRQADGDDGRDGRVSVR